MVQNENEIYSYSQKSEKTENENIFHSKKLMKKAWLYPSERLVRESLKSGKKPTKLHF